MSLKEDLAKLARERIEREGVPDKTRPIDSRKFRMGFRQGAGNSERNTVAPIQGLRDGETPRPPAISGRVSAIFPNGGGRG